MSGNSERWRGILIEASIDSRRVLDHLRILGTKQSILEGEPERGRLNSWKVEVTPDELDSVIASSEESLKGPGWYFHLTRGDEMIVIFPKHTERFSRQDKVALDKAVHYGVETAGVPSEQIELGRFFGNPFDE